jgi:hypothetical protein
VTAAKALAPSDAGSVSPDLLAAIEALPSDHDAHDFFKAVYRAKGAPLDARFAAAAKALAVEKPKPVGKDGPAEPSIHDGARDKLRNKLDRLSGPGTASEASGKPH